MSNRKSKRRWQDDEEKALEELLFSKDKVIGKYKKSLHYHYHITLLTDTIKFLRK